MNALRVRRTDRARRHGAGGPRARLAGFWLGLLATLLTLAGQPSPAADDGGVAIRASICSASPDGSVHAGEGASAGESGSDARGHAHCDFCASQVSPFGFDRPQPGGQRSLCGPVTRIVLNDRDPGVPPSIWAAARSRAPPTSSG